MEESTAAELSESEAKQRSLGAAFESLRSQASSILQFTVEWKELEDHFESTRTALKARFEQLQNRAKEAAEMQATASRLTAEVERRWKEAEEGESYLESVKALVKENDEELRVREERYESLERLIREKERELMEVDEHVKKKTRKLSWVEKRIEVTVKEAEVKKEEVVKVVKEKEEKVRLMEKLIWKRRKEVELKEGEMVMVRRRIEDCERELKEKEEMVRVANEKGREFCLLKRSMEEWGCKVEVKERELEGLAARLELKEREVGLKVEELGLIRKEFLNEVQLKEEHLISLEKWLLEWEKDLHSLQKSVEECSRGSVITRDGRGLQRFMDDHLKRIDSLGTDLSAILKESPDPGKLVLDAMQGFYPEKRESGFELRVRRRSCCLLLEELMRMSPQMNPQVKEEATKLAANWKAKMKVASDKDLEVLGFLWLVAAYGLTSIYETKELKRLLSNVSHGLQAAQIGVALGITALGSHICSPVKLEEPEYSAANKAATNSSPNCQSSAPTDARISVANNAAIISSLNPQSSAATDARNPAANNSATIASNNPQSSASTDARNSRGSINEHLSWNSDTIQTELVAAVESASDPEKLVLMMMQKTLVQYWTTTESSTKKAIMSCNITLLEVLMRVSPQVKSHVKEDAKTLAFQWFTKIGADAGHHLEILGFLLFVHAYGLLPTLPGDEMVKFLERLSQHKEAVESLKMHGVLNNFLDDFIPRLVEEKQLFQALGFVFKFRLLDKFTPVRVLKDYVKDVSLSEALKRKKSVDEKVEFIDSQIADLKAVLRCIREYNLESEYPSKEIEVQIGELEKLKDICRGPEKYLASVTRQQAQSRGKKRSSSTSPAVQPGQQRNKFHQTAEASPTSYKSPRFTPVHLQSTVSRSSPSLALAYGNNVQGGQVGDMASNSSEVDRSSSLRYRNHDGLPGRVGNAAANSVEFDRSSSLVSGIHGWRGQLDHMVVNLAEVNPHFGTIDEVDPHFGAPNLSNPYQFWDFTPFPARYGPY